MTLFSRIFRKRRVEDASAAPAAAAGAGLFDGAGCVGVSVGPDGAVADAGAGAAAMLSAAAEHDAECGNRAPSFPDWFMPEDRGRVAAACAAGGPSRLIAHGRRPDGSVGAFEIIMAPRERAPASVLILDRTEETRSQERLARSLDAARSESRSGAAALADLSHEMKTPLNAVIGFADALREETFGPLGHPRYAEYADHIHASGAHLLDLVKSILDLARIEADRLTLAPVIADPNRIAEECAAMVRQTAEKNGLTLVVDLDTATPECAFDPRAVRQILVNLLANAVKFTSDGEVRVSVSTSRGANGRDELGGDDGAGTDEYLVFTVADTGIGMDAAALEKLGPRFTDAQGAGVRGADGAGLGLSLAFKLAELHGGALKIASAPGEGVTARLELPLDRSGAARAPERRIPSAPAPFAPTQLERIEARRREAARRRARAAA